MGVRMVCASLGEFCLRCSNSQVASSGVLAGGESQSISCAPLGVGCSPFHRWMLEGQGHQVGWAEWLSDLGLTLRLRNLPKFQGENQRSKAGERRLGGGEMKQGGGRSASPGADG